MCQRTYAVNASGPLLHGRRCPGDAVMHDPRAECVEIFSLLYDVRSDHHVRIAQAIKAHNTTAQIAQMFDVHPTQVGGWKKQALAGLPDIFGNGREQMRQQSDAEKDELYRQIGQLKVELDFLKKRAGLLA